MAGEDIALVVDVDVDVEEVFIIFEGVTGVAEDRGTLIVVLEAFGVAALFSSFVVVREGVTAEAEVTVILVEGSVND